VPGIDESVEMPMTDEGRRGTLDVVGSICREAAYLNGAIQRTRLRQSAELFVRRYIIQPGTRMILFAFLPAVGVYDLLVIVAVALLIWPTWRICSKAGFPGILGLLIVVPLFNLVLIYYLAFAEWPSLRRQKEYAGIDDLPLA
jgi:hypothetical protein